MNIMKMTLYNTLYLASIKVLGRNKLAKKKKVQVGIGKRFGFGQRRDISIIRVNSRQ